MGFSQVWIEGQRIEGGFLGLGHYLHRRSVTVECQERVSVRKTSMCRCIIRFFAQCPLEALDRFFQAGPSLVPKRAPLEVKFMCNRIDRGPGCEPFLLLWRDLSPNRVGDSLRYFALQRKDIF